MNMLEELRKHASRHELIHPWTRAAEALVLWAVDALRLAEEALEDIGEFDTCDCPTFTQDGFRHRRGCTWTKVLAALTAIRELKDERSI